MTDDKKISKQMSFWLRHKPEDAGLDLSRAGWADVAALLEALNKKGLACDRARLTALVQTNDKKRYEFSGDGHQIRARQGHSVSVDLGLAPVLPPDRLFHGTAERFLPAILKDGLKPMKRHHVHLSGDTDTALSVGRRHGKPVILTVQAGDMAANGHVFYRTDNGVWLAASVPPGFLALTSDPR